MSQPSPDRADAGARSSLAEAGALGVVVVLVLGVLRTSVQIIARDAYRHPVPVALTMFAVTGFWLPVPLLVHRISGVVRSPVRRVAWHVAAALSVAAAECAWVIAVFPRTHGPRLAGGYWVNAALRLDTNLLVYAAIAGLLWLRATQQRRDAMAQSAVRLRTRAAEAELDVLTMQLQPHFLFNTLNLVSQLAYESADRARGALRNLRELLRESIEHGARGTVTLGEELRFLDAYLDLQRERFGARLDAQVAVDADLFSVCVPHMLLQPIVENAIRHGVARRGAGGSIRITARRAPDDRVSIEVADDGPGLGPSAFKEGVGLGNVRLRLEQLFGREAGLSLRERPGGGTIARVDLPHTTVVRDADTPLDVDDRDVVLDRAAAVPGDTHETRPNGVVRAAVILAAWALVAAVWTELEAVVPMATGQPTPWSAMFARNALNAVVWAGLTPLALWFTDRLSTRPYAWRIGAHVLGAGAFTALHLFATGALMRAALKADAMSVHSVRFGWAVWDVVAYIAIVALAELLTARARLRREALDAARARARLASARVSLLRLQLQPSILLTSLDAVASVIADPTRCETVIARVGDVLRLLLASAGRDETTLDAELALLNAYLEVVGGEPAATAVTTASRQACMPAVLLQPLAASLGGRCIRASVSRTVNRLVVELFVADQPDHPVDADRLASVEQRLGALYGDDCELRVVCRDGNVGVHLDIPYREATRPNAGVLARPRLAIA